jgi:hypothetical protein
METKEDCQQNRPWHNRIWHFIGFSILGVIGFAAFALIFGIVIQWLWNGLMPSLFHITTITFWQAVGLAILLRLLFGCSHHGGHHRCGGRFWKHTRWHKHDDCQCDRSKWHYYDRFWEEEGEKAFHDYVHRKFEADKGQETKS